MTAIEKRVCSSSREEGAPHEEPHGQVGQEAKGAGKWGARTFIVVPTGEAGKQTEHG